jgi:type IV secretory pathway VirB2 component (pilin)
MKELIKIFADATSGAGDSSAFQNAINNIPNNNPDTMVTNVLNFVYLITGIIAVIVIIIAGISYMTSQGQPDKTKKALSTIIYAVIGLVVVLVAAFITNFVITRLGGA